MDRNWRKKEIYEFRVKGHLAWIYIFSTFSDSAVFTHAALQLVDAKTSTTDVLVATYQLAEPKAG